MARHLEANCQLCRRCGDKLMLKGNRCMTPKCVMERRHKTAAVGSRGRRRRVSEHGMQLIENKKPVIFMDYLRDSSDVSMDYRLNNPASPAIISR